jgi:hypothetical protein
VYACPFCPIYTYLLTYSWSWALLEKLPYTYF